MKFADVFAQLERGVPTPEEIRAAFGAILAGEWTPVQIGAFATALRLRGESPAAIVAAARALLDVMTAVDHGLDEVIDTCGTGGDGAHTINVSTAAAIVVAGAGAYVAKHGNRSVSSRCGSADVLEALGVNIAAPPDVVERCLDEAGIAFFFAPTFHPSMRHAAQARKELGIRTAFNLLGPLTNPAGATRQLVGVPRPELTELVARSLALLGSERAWVVHGADGLDEISTTGYTKVSEVKDGAVNTFYVHPHDFKLPKASPEALRGGDAAENAAITRRVLSGKPGPAREIVLLNTGIALLIAGKVPTVREGIDRAAEAIDSGATQRTLEKLIVVSRIGVAA